jgi:hypothetical protein
MQLVQMILYNGNISTIMYDNKNHDLKGKWKL